MARPAHPFDGLDTPAVARALSQIADRDEDLADAYFERLEELTLPAEGDAPGVRLRREEGLAIRLVRDGHSWMAARDEITPAAFSESLRRVARALPSAFYPEPRLEVSPPGAASGTEELADFPLAVARAVRARHVAFPLRLTVRRHRREIQVVGPRLVPEAETETYYSLEAEMPWGRWGTLLPGLDGAAEEVAGALVERFRCRNAPPPEGRSDAVVVLGSGAAAVLLHEAVAHALEADSLALSGGGAARGSAAERAVGVALGPEGLNVLDDPSTAPEPVRRRSDDEGSAVTRRWLLEAGVVRQPLADRAWARGSDVLLPGAGRRASRHEPPGPRSTHLELLPGDVPEQDLVAEADDGFLVPELAGGRLDPVSGRLVLDVPCARRIRSGTPADPVGPFRLVGAVAGLLEHAVAVGSTVHPGGAGWCAKGGRKLPVWATAPSLRLDGVEVEA
ncbi:MAG: metallopeptidase TldD-related protein [Thermoanaerobaculia bacterium]